MTFIGVCPHCFQFVDLDSHVCREQFEDDVAEAIALEEMDPD